MYFCYDDYGLISLFLFKFQGGLLQVVGCFGAMKLQEKLLNLYWNILLGLLFGDAIVGIIWIFRFDKIADSLRFELKSKVQAEYGNNRHFEQLWNRLQEENQCCGVVGPNDYINMTAWSPKNHNENSEHLIILPDSCCEPGDIFSTDNSPLKSCAIQNVSNVNRTYFSDGCHDVVHRWLQKRADILFLLGYCVISFLKLCFLGILKYEIREMIQKINMLNGSRDECSLPQPPHCYSVPSPSSPQLAPARGHSTTSINTVKLTDIPRLHHSSPVINSTVNQKYNSLIPLAQLKALGTLHHNTGKITLKNFNGNNNEVVELRELHPGC